MPGGLFLSSSCSVIQLFLCTPPFPYSFLSLAGNRIRQVENLRDLPHLQFLDLSENLIEKLKLGMNTLTLAHPLSSLPPSPCACINGTSSRGSGGCAESSGFGLEGGYENLIPPFWHEQMNSLRAFSSST